MREVQLYRKQNLDGTRKDWAHPLTPDPAGLTVYYGRTGSVLRLAYTPAQQCHHGSPGQEARARAFEKARNGYQDLGAHRLADNRRDLTPLAVAPSVGGTVEPPLAPGWYWRWGFNRSHAARHQALEVAYAVVAAQFEAVGWSPPQGQPDHGGPRLRCLWSKTERDAGCAWQPGETLGQAAFWLLLSRTLPEFSLQDAAGHGIRVWPWPLSTSGDCVSYLQQLGLLQTAVSDWLNDALDVGWFY